MKGSFSDTKTNRTLKTKPHPKTRHGNSQTQGREEVLIVLPPATKKAQHPAKISISGWTRDTPSTSLLGKYTANRVLKIEVL